MNRQASRTASLRRAMRSLVVATIPAIGWLTACGDNDSWQNSNPLATAQQLQSETLADQIVATPMMMAAIAEVLPIYQQAAAGDHDVYARGLSDVQELAYATALTATASDPYRPNLVLAASGPHNWLGMSVSGSRFGWDNPDNVYRWGVLDSASQYVIHGQRRNPGPKDVNISLLTDIFLQQTVANLAGKDLQISLDGTYTVTIDSNPDNGQPNHLQMTAQTEAVIVRNTMDDWATENPDSISIERVGGPPAAAVPTLDQMATLAVSKLHVAANFIYASGFPTLVPLNSFNQPPPIGQAQFSLATQRGSPARFQLADDQALVVQANLGGTGYFTLPVTDQYGVSVHPGEIQSSLNNFQAQPNADGSYTFVVSVQDPGVQNWVDTGGVRTGSLYARWQLLPKTVPASGDASISAQLVNFRDLASALPAQMSRVSPAQRAVALQQRNAAYLRRYQVPYPQ